MIWYPQFTCTTAEQDRGLLPVTGALFVTAVSGLVVPFGLWIRLNPRLGAGPGEAGGARGAGMRAFVLRTEPILLRAGADVPRASSHATGL